MLAYRVKQTFVYRCTVKIECQHQPVTGFDSFLNLFNNIIMFICSILPDWLRHEVAEFLNIAVIAQMTCFSLYKRHKAGGSNNESILVSQLQHGLALEFEHSDPLRRLRLVLSELLAIMNKVAIFLCLFLLHLFIYVFQVFIYLQF